MPVRILSTGSFLGTNVVDNCALYSRIQNFDRVRALETLKKKGNEVSGLADEELFDLWVRQVCGVERRVFFTRDQVDEEGPEPLTEYMGFKAGKEALERAGVSPETIDLLIFCSFTPDQVIPNPGCTVSHYLGCFGKPAFHINTACSSFLDGLGNAYLLIRSGQYKRVMVVASERMSAHIDFGDVTTAILFGDGACAAILEETEAEGGVLSFVSMTDFNKDMLHMDYGEPIRMGGGALVQRNAVNAMSRSLEEALKQADLTFEDVDFLFPHQANLRILQSLANKVKVPSERMVQSVIFTGNTSGSSIGIGLDYALQGRIEGVNIRQGNLLGLTTVGGGYTFSGLVYRV